MRAGRQEEKDMVTDVIGISMPRTELRSMIEDAWHDSAATTAGRLLEALDERGRADLPRYLHGGWSHLFQIPGRQVERQCRIVFDRTENAVSVMQVRASSKWRDSTLAERQDVTDSIVNANPEALEDPAAWELDRSATLPAWAS